jgi:hypothetical protein
MVPDAEHGRAMSRDTTVGASIAIRDSCCKFPRRFSRT